MAWVDVSWTILLSRLLAIYVSYRISWTIYSVYFGPLSKVPGPKLAAASRLVTFYHRVTGYGEHWRCELHRQYGDVVRTAPGEVSFATGKVWRSIYGYAPGTNVQIMTKDHRSYHSDKPDIDVLVARVSDHARHRKVFSHAFSDKALRQQAPILQRYIDQLISNLSGISQKPDSKIDMLQNYNFITFDIMGDLTFGEPLGCLQNSAYTPWINFIYGVVRVMVVIIELNYIIPHLPTAAKVVNAVMPRAMTGNLNKHINYTVEQIDKRLARTDPRPDIWGLILSAKEEQKLTTDEMRANGQLFMAAGTETTATALSGLTYHLLRNPDKMATLTKAIRTSFSSADEIDSVSVSGLPYLNACIEEALRLYPPAPLGLPRVTGKGGAVLCGYDIPEDTVVYTHMLSTFRNHNNFHRADSFLPERWLQDSPAEFLDDDRASFQPFSIGPRACLGTNLAYLEIRLIITNILWRFDLELCPESNDWANQRIFLLWEKKPLMVRLKQVNGGNEA